MMRRLVWMIVCVGAFGCDLTDAGGGGSNDAGTVANADVACTVSDVDGGGKRIRCPDGSEVTWRGDADGAAGADGTDGTDGKDGANGEDGSSCSVTDNGDGTKTIACDDGTSVTVTDGAKGEPGDPGVDAVPGEVVCEGDYVVDSVSELLFVAGCTTITGDLDIDTGSGTSVRLPVLESIGGNLYIASTDLERLSFPRLTTVDENIAAFGNSALTDLDFAALTIVAKFLEIGNNDVLANLDLPLLERTQYFYVGYALALTEVSVPSLTTVETDNFSIWGNDALTSLSAPALRTVGGIVSVGNNPMLPACQAQAIVDQLVTYNGATFIDGNDDVATCP